MFHPRGTTLIVGSLGRNQPTDRELAVGPRHKSQEEIISVTGPRVSEKVIDVYMTNNQASEDEEACFTGRIHVLGQ
jgi:hypothetical protein